MVSLSFVVAFVSRYRIVHSCSASVSIALRLMPLGLRLLKVVELQEPRRCALMISGRRFLKEEPRVIEA